MAAGKPRAKAKAGKKSGARKRKAKGGRPAIKIELGKIELLAKLHPTQAEAAAALQVSPATFKRWLEKREVREVWDRGFSMAKLSLRRIQWGHARRSVPMAIFLGKNILGQSDRQAHEHTGPDGGPIRVDDARERVSSRIAGLVTRFAKKKDPPPTE